jgi:hypothetical protein
MEKMFLGHPVCCLEIESTTIRLVIEQSSVWLKKKNNFRQEKSEITEWFCGNEKIMQKRFNTNVMIQLKNDGRHFCKLDFLPNLTSEMVLEPLLIF